MADVGNGLPIHVGPVEIRPVPGYDGYYAGSDGMIYRKLKPHVLPSGKFRDVTVSRDGRSVHRPLAWFVARAWVEGYEFGRGMHARFLNGDTLDTRPCNLRWATPKELEKERNDRYNESVRRRLAADPDDPRHGTLTGYTRGCRCDRCRPMGKVAYRRNQVRKTMREGGLL